MSMSEPPGLRLRRFEDRDGPDLVRNANNRKIWLNLQDSFPHPYTAASAERWLGLRAADPEPAPHLAIEVDGTLVGVIGFEAGEDVHRLVGSIGYWIGEPYWGRGIATAALRAMTRFPTKIMFDLR